MAAKIVPHMKLATLVAALCLAGLSANAASGQSICRIYEYVELKDMRQAELEQMYCQYGQDSKDMLRAATLNMNAGNRGASQRDQTDAIRCSDEQDRIGRALESKYSVKAICKPSPAAR